MAKNKNQNQANNAQKIKDAAAEENAKSAKANPPAEGNTETPTPVNPEDAAKKAGAVPVALVSINGGEKFDASTDEGKKRIADFMEQAKEEIAAGNKPKVSLNDGPEYDYDAPELQKAFEDLAAFPVHDQETDSANADAAAQRDKDAKADKKADAKETAKVKANKDSTTVTNPDTGMAVKTTSPRNPNETFTEGPQATAPELAPKAPVGKVEAVPHKPIANPNEKFSEGPRKHGA